jgi:hypothetical protein
VVVELRGDDVVLARELWWCGKARSELSTRSRRRRRTVAVGEDCLGGNWEMAGARKHEWRLGKPAEKLAGAMDGM